MKKTVYASLACLVLLCGVLGWKTGQLSAENEQLREELQAAQGCGASGAKSQTIHRPLSEPYLGLFENAGSQQGDPAP